MIVLPRTMIISPIHLILDIFYLGAINTPTSCMAERNNSEVFKCWNPKVIFKFYFLEVLVELVSLEGIRFLRVAKSNLALKMRKL